MIDHQTKYRAFGLAASLTFAFAMSPTDAQAQGAVKVPAAVLEKYVGDWVYPDGASFKVSRHADTLFQEAPGRRLAYAALSENKFMLGPVFTAEFVRDEAGGETQILSDGAGIEYRLHRKGAPPPPPAVLPKGVRVPKAVLDRYVGTYEYIPGQMKRTDLRIMIRREGDALVREGAGPATVLVPVSNTLFKVGTTSLVVEFVVDEAGVTQIMGTGFQQMLTRLTSKP